MNQILTIISIILFWIASLVEPSGWGMAYHLNEKLTNLMIVGSIILLYKYRTNYFKISPILLFVTILSIAFIPMLVSGKNEGWQYMSSFLVIYILANGDISEKVIKLTAFAVALLGLSVLYIYSRGNLLSGWNDNAISMTGLFSFIYFTIFLTIIRYEKTFWLFNIITVVYLSLLFATDCRSGMLFSIVTVICIVFPSTTQRILSKSWVHLLILNIPLIIALIVIAASTSSYYDELNMWSINNFGKTIFNGRDVLWQLSFDMLEKSNYLGTGKFIINYHNSGVAALSVFGIFGYACWISFFYTILSKMKKYMEDPIVFGSILGFVIIYLQQSVDLGFISSTPNLIPYMILGVGLGRIGMLSDIEKDVEVEYIYAEE